MRKIPLIFFCSIIVLASFGLIFQIATEPLQLILSLLKMLVVAAVLFAIVYFLFFRSKQTSDSSKKYKQAVKQSQKKYGNSNTHISHKNSINGSKKKAKRKATHLRVIEGNKSKKDDRASF